MRDALDTAAAVPPLPEAAAAAKAEEAAAAAAAAAAGAAQGLSGDAADLWAQLAGCGRQDMERQLLLRLAQQLALYEQQLFCAVRPCELQRLAFARADKAARAPHVHALIVHFNRMSRWVCAAIVREVDRARRAQALRLFIELARACLELRNFNGLLEVVAALNSAAVHRLKQTWEALPAASLQASELALSSP